MLRARGMPHAFSREKTLFSLKRTFPQHNIPTTAQGGSGRLHRKASGSLPISRGIAS